MATPATTPPPDAQRPAQAARLTLAQARDIIAQAPRLSAPHQAYLVRELAVSWAAHHLCSDALYDAADAIERAAREEDAALHGVDVGARLPGASPWERAA